MSVSSSKLLSILEAISSHLNIAGLALQMENDVEDSLHITSLPVEILGRIFDELDEEDRCTSLNEPCSLFASLHLLLAFPTNQNPNLAPGPFKMLEFSVHCTP